MSTPVMDLFDLKGRTALVTGGSRGLGLQIAEALGEAGAKVLLSARKADELEHAVAHLQDLGIDARWVAADTSLPEQVQRVVDEAMQRLAGDAPDLGRLARIGGDPARVDALVLQMRGGFLEVRGLARRQQHARAGLAERLGDLQAEPARAAGDDRRAAGKVEELADIHGQEC